MVKVKVAQGWLEGEQKNLVTGDGKYFSFKGIPYAAPPLGKLRFKAPKPPQSWNGVRKALEHGPICHQYDILTNSILTGSEDCLYLNVYSPNISSSNVLFPVMFWIHGGAFMSGSGNSDFYGPDFLVCRDVVVVTINYRLDVLGFLCLDTAEVPGNAGLKDQVAALRWVRENIANFGGDPENVTLFGESAGAASVGYHLLSPLSTGLFRRAILMSGVPLCDWASTFEPKKRALRLAQQLGATSEDPEKVLEFLQSVPVNKFIKQDAAILLRESIGTPIINCGFNPVAEVDFGKNDHFLTGKVIDYLNKGIINDVDIMIGYTSRESIFFADFLKENVGTIEQHIECLLPNEIAFKLPLAHGLRIADEIKRHYFGEKSICIDNIDKLVDHSSWYIFKYNILRFLRYLESTKSKKYLYHFSCETERNVFKKYFSQGRDFSGVCHLDDLVYLFDQSLNKLSHKESEGYRMIQQTTALWSNFAKYGNPTPDNSLGFNWPPYDSNAQQYMDIGVNFIPGSALDREEFTFWDNIYSAIN